MCILLQKVYKIFLFGLVEQYNLNRFSKKNQTASDDSKNSNIKLKIQLFSQLYKVEEQKLYI